MALKPMFVGSEQIMNAFEQMRGDYICWSLWSAAPRIKYTQYTGDDIEISTEKLSDIITAAEQSDNREIFIIQVHPKAENAFSGKSDVFSTLIVRVCDVGGTARVGNVSNEPYESRLPNAVYYTLKRIDEGLPAITAQHKELSARLLKLETAPEATEKSTDWLTQMERIGSIPGMTDLFGRVLQMLPALAGVPIDNRVIAGTNEPHNNEMVIPPVQGYVSINRDINNEHGHVDRITENSLVNTDITPGEPLPYTLEENAAIDAAITKLSGYMDIVNDLPLLAEYAEKQPQMFGFLLMQLKQAPNEKG